MRENGGTRLPAVSPTAQLPAKLFGPSGASVPCEGETNIYARLSSPPHGILRNYVGTLRPFPSGPSISSLRQAPFDELRVFDRVFNRVFDRALGRNRASGGRLGAGVDARGGRRELAGS